MRSLFANSGVQALVAAVLALVSPYSESQAQGTASTLSPNQSEVIYGRKNGLALTLETFRAAQPNGLGVVWVVTSGGKSSRSRALSPSSLRRIKPLVDCGYTVFAVVHGSAPLYYLQDWVQDIKRAVRFVRCHADEFAVDPASLAIAGSSAGGHLALMIAMNPDDGDAQSEDPVERVSNRVQAVGSFFAPTDFLNYAKPDEDLFSFLRNRGATVPPMFYELDEQTGVRAFVEDRARQNELFRRFSPIFSASADAPPTIMIHGEADPRVPVYQSVRLADRLRAIGVDVKLVVRKGKRHAWEGWEDETALIADWFDAHLR